MEEGTNAKNENQSAETRQSDRPGPSTEGRETGQPQIAIHRGSQQRSQSDFFGHDIKIGAVENQNGAQPREDEEKTEPHN